MEKGNFLGINWEVRASNPHFWFKIFLSIAVVINRGRVDTIYTYIIMSH